MKYGMSISAGPYEVKAEYEELMDAVLAVINFNEILKSRLPAEDIGFIIKALSKMSEGECYGIELQGFRFLDGRVKTNFSSTKKGTATAVPLKCFT